MIVPQDQEARFIEFWDRGAAYVAQQPGFVSTSLHRNAHAGEFQFYTVACWASEEAFQAATATSWWQEFVKEFGFGDPSTGLRATSAVCQVMRDPQSLFAG